MVQEFNVAVTFPPRHGARPDRGGPVPTRGPPGLRGRTAQLIPPGGRGAAARTGPRRPSGPPFPCAPGAYPASKAGARRRSLRRSEHTTPDWPFPTIYRGFREHRKNRPKNGRQASGGLRRPTVDWSRSGIFSAHETTNVDVEGRKRPSGDDCRYSGDHQRCAARPPVIEIFHHRVTGFS